MHSILLARALPLTLLPMLTGCLFTVPMWENANERFATGPVVFGVVEPDAGDARGNDGGRLLVIRYTVHFENELYTTIPLNPQGCPIEPYGYAGDERSPDAIVNDLPEARRQQLRAMRLVLHDEKWAKRLKTDPRFRRVNWTTDGLGYRDVLFEKQNDEDRTCRYEVRVRALRLGRPWTETEAAAMPVGGNVRMFPADSCVFVLPYAQPRPRAEYRKARLRATLLTPVTLAGDAVGIPVLFVACYVFGQCP